MAYTIGLCAGHSYAENGLPNDTKPGSHSDGFADDVVVLGVTKLKVL